MRIVSRPPRVVVGGYAARYPLGGYLWQVVHYLLGFQRLGCESFFYEDNLYYGDAFDPMSRTVDDQYESGCAILAAAFRGFGLEGRWSFYDGVRQRHWGAGEEDTRRRFAEADLYVNLGGVNRIGKWPRPPVAVYVDMDPAFTQINLHDGDPAVREILAEHDLHFTFGENIGSGRSPIPSGGVDWRPTRQVVVPDLWRMHPAIGPCFTTVASWGNDDRDRSFRGEVLRWSKGSEWLRFLALPERTGMSFEVAMDVLPNDPGAAELLGKAGWRARDPVDVSIDHRKYRDYIEHSLGEFSVAKEMYVRLRSGWFSDRSACYLAAGRPVILQDTGFSDVLPTGEGLFAVVDIEQAERAVRDVIAAYERHRAAARTIAVEWLSPQRVLAPILDAAGLGGWTK
jgi:hypothetical protein